MLYSASGIKKTPTPKKTKSHRTKHFIYTSTPSERQTILLQHARKIALKYAHRSKSELIKQLNSEGFNHIAERRIQSHGGIGSFRWYPKLKCYRLQLAASHINRYGDFMPYALCLHIY